MRILSPMTGSPAWGSGIRRRIPQSIWLWSPAELDYRNSTELRGNRDSTLGGRTQGLTCTGTQGKRSDFLGSLAKLTCWSWRVSWGGKREGGSRCGSLWGQGHWWQGYQGGFISMSSPGRRHFGTSYRFQWWDASGQTTSRATHQQTGFLKISWAASRHMSWVMRINLIYVKL